MEQYLCTWGECPREYNPAIFVLPGCVRLCLAMYACVSVRVCVCVLCFCMHDM
jgi:hypothetical protein